MERIPKIYFVSYVLFYFILFFDFSPHNYRQESEVKTKASLAQYIKVIWIDKEAKNLFMFIILSTTFTFVEIMYGTMSNSLGMSL